MITKFSIVMVIVFYLFFIYMASDDLANTIQKPKTEGFNFASMPIAFGIFLYSYDINGIITEIR